MECHNIPNMHDDDEVWRGRGTQENPVDCCLKSTLGAISFQYSGMVLPWEEPIVTESVFTELWVPTTSHRLALYHSNVVPDVSRSHDKLHIQEQANLR